MEKQSIEKMSIAQIWSLAKARGIEVKGKKKPQLVKAIIEYDSKDRESEPSLPEGDGKPPKEVEPEVKEEVVEMITFKSVDGRNLEASVGNAVWNDKVIQVPVEQKEEVERLLTEGGFYFIIV